jgi:argonaute-like protein implicated in RNA metabolism and viral defense
MLQAGIDIFDFLHVTDSNIRLYRDGVYPPLRGTFLQTSSRSFRLYTKGSVPFFETYPGLYVPRPIEVTIADGEQTPLALAKEILALTKMNWNSTQFDGSMPLTITAAAGVGKVLKHCTEGQRVEPRYSFYM